MTLIFIYGHFSTSQRFHGRARDALQEALKFQLSKRIFLVVNVSDVLIIFKLNHTTTLYLSPIK
jgi:hypothetical protein